MLFCQQLSSVSSVLTNDESGLRATDMQTIIEMMGPQDLSELEDEVKVIKNDVRAWVLRCNYKSLRKALRTLQVREDACGAVFEDRRVCGSSLWKESC